MDLKSGYPYWALKNGLMHAFPPLKADARCEVAIIGAGISGALIANELSRHGHDVIVLERRDVAWGSTSASTALLQYENDIHLTDLAKEFGEEHALLAYRACAKAILQLRALAGVVRDVDFSPAQSLYCVSKARDTERLYDEYKMRQRNGFAVQWLNAAQVQAEYRCRAPGAILTDLAARVDPYRLTYRLLQRLQKQGVVVNDRSTVERVKKTPRGVSLYLSSGHQVHAGHVVVAAGYDCQSWLKQRVARNRSSYACITDPLDADTLGPLAHTLVWESARPYLYMRSTGDGRLLIGGEDDVVDVPVRRDARVHKKSQRLLKKVHALFPRLQLEPAFAWAGTFAETKDGLPYFGPHAQYGPRVHFAMAYGGNGIVYSMLGAELLRALIEKRKHRLAPLFSFARLG